VLGTQAPSVEAGRATIWSGSGHVRCCKLSWLSRCSFRNSLWVSRPWMAARRCDSRVSKSARCCRTKVSCCRKMSTGVGLLLPPPSIEEEVALTNGPRSPRPVVAGRNWPTGPLLLNSSKSSTSSADKSSSSSSLLLEESVFAVLALPSEWNDDDVDDDADEADGCRTPSHGAPDAFGDALERLHNEARQSSSSSMLRRMSGRLVPSRRFFQCPPPPLPLPPLPPLGLGLLLGLERAAAAAVAAAATA